MFCLLISCFIMAGSSTQPSGYWVLDNISDETPYGKLELDHPMSFKLLIYDCACQHYKAEGSVRKKTEQSWELKNAADYSNTFIMTRKEKKLQLVDTEGQCLLFSKTTSKTLEQGVSQHCPKNPSFNNKVKP